MLIIIINYLGYSCIFLKYLRNIFLVMDKVVIKLGWAEDSDLKQTIGCLIHQRSFPV